MQDLESVAMCPVCAAVDLKWNTSNVACIACRSVFSRDGGFVDFVDPSRLQNLEVTALQVWGDDLHSTALAAPPHYGQLQRLFPDLWRSSLRGAVLEIGCGSGTDLVRLSGSESSVAFFAFDIGANVANLARTFGDRSNIRIFRGNALQIPLRAASIDMVYSYGVFHHTRDPVRCLAEAHRVLKTGGAMFFYLYSAHEDMPVKYAGILLETALMRLLAVLPTPLRLPLLRAISVACLVLFSWPAKLLKLFGAAKTAEKFPMHWGTSPGSILPDLKDRLLSPVNHRFRRGDLEAVLERVGFRRIQVTKTSSGLFGYCAK